MNLAEGVVRLRIFRGGQHGAPSRIERLVEPVEFLQRQRSCRKRARVRRREGEERIENAQGLGVVMPRGLYRGEVDVSVGEARVPLDRPSRHGLGAVVFALIKSQVREVAVDLGVVGLKRERRVPALLRFRRMADALQGVAEIVERLRVVRRERERPFEAEPALVELQGLLQNDAEIVPAARSVGVKRDRAAPGLFGLDEQPLLAAHLGKVAEIDGGRPRRLAGLPHMGDGEV